MGPSCLEAWAYDRMGTPCLEPATHTVQADGSGGRGRYIVCDGRARAARIHIVGSRIVSQHRVTRPRLSPLRQSAGSRTASRGCCCRGTATRR